MGNNEIHTRIEDFILEGSRRGGRYVGDMLEDSTILNNRRLWMVAKYRHTCKRVRGEEGLIVGCRYVDDNNIVQNTVFSTHRK